MLIEIEPALIGQSFGLGATDIRELIISTRHAGQTLYPISEWPSFVYVARILNDAVLRTLGFSRLPPHVSAAQLVNQRFDCVLGKLRGHGSTRSPGDST